MRQTLFKIFALAVGGVIINELLSPEGAYNKKANAHQLFLDFEQALSLTPAKKSKLIRARVALQKRIVEYFRLYTHLPLPKFYIQGSYKMKTLITDDNGTYDVDLGIYFLTKPQVEPYTLQKYIYNAVNGHTTGGTEHRKKCIRVIYSGDFDVDLPVYYMSRSDMHPFLATKEGWQESDPKELCDWFDKLRKSQKDKYQLPRIVKYFKAWANKQNRKMPSGIALTVWVSKYYKSNSRDDISFYETAKAIKESFGWSISCKNPVTPWDDFLKNMSDVQKNNFVDRLGNLIKNSGKALNEDKLQKSIDIWQNIFGYKFAAK